MGAFYRYRVWCETEGAYVYEDGETAPTQCPNDGGHTIDASKTALVTAYLDRNTPVIAVADESQLDAAVARLNLLGGGTIVLTAPITLTSAKSWDLGGINIFGDGSSGTHIYFPSSSEYITIAGGAIFTKVRFTGNESGNTQNILRFTDPDNGRVLFLNCMFKNIIGDTNPTTSEVIRYDGSGGGGWTFDFIQCDWHSGDNNRNPFTMRNVGGSEYINVGISNFLRQEYNYNRFQFLGNTVSSVSKYASDGSVRVVSLPSQITESNWIGPSIIDAREAKTDVSIFDEILLSDSEEDYTLKRSTLYDVALSLGFRTRFVDNEIEFDAAYEALRNLGGGAIYLTGQIDLTEDKCWDLTDITIYGSPIGHYTGLPPTRIDFNGYTITLIGQGCHFQDVVLNGTLTTPVGVGSQTLFLAATYGCGSDSSSSPGGEPEYSGRTYQFIRVQFRNCVGGLSAGNVIDLSGLNDGIGYDKYVTTRFEMCTQHTDSMSPGQSLYGLVIEYGALGGVGDFDIDTCYTFIKDAQEGSWANRNAYGVRAGGSGSGWVWHDDTVQMVETTGVGTVSTVGFQPVAIDTGTNTLIDDFAGTLRIWTDNSSRTVGLGTDASGGSGDHVYLPGVFIDLIKTGTGNLNIGVPSGVTLWYENAEYTNETVFVSDTPGLRHRLTYVAIDEWVLSSGDDFARQQSDEPMGLPNSDDTYTTISWDDGTTTLQIAPVGASFDVWVQGKRYRKTSAETLVGDGTDFVIAEGEWYFYYNGSGTLVASQTPWDLSQYAPIAIIYWDATNSKALLGGVFDERHGLVIPWATHEYLHVTRGAQYSSGLGITVSFDGAGSADSEAEIAIADGVLYDEDLKIEIIDGAGAGRFEQELDPIAQIPVLYKSGVNGYWREIVPGNFPIIYGQVGTGRAEYNNPNAGGAGVWGLTEVPNADFMDIIIIGTNSYNQPIAAICGQAVYATLGTATAADPLASLDLSNLPFQEVRYLYRLVVQTRSAYSNTPKSRFRSSGFADYRKLDLGSPAGATLPTDHQALSNRDAIGAHPATAISVDGTSLSGNLLGAGDDVQEIIDFIDDLNLDQPVIIDVTQATHGFTDPTSAVCIIHHNGTSWVKAQANTPANAEGCWVVIEVIDVNEFRAQKIGDIDITGWGLSAGTVYFLDASTAGAITTTPPDTIGHVVLPIIYAHTTTEGEILHLIGSLITVGSSGSDANKTWEFLADMLATPNTADWGLNSPAAVISDPTNTAIPVAAFDDTTEEGVGMEVHIPLDATRIRIAIEYRAASAPGSAQTVDFRFRHRGVPDNSAFPSWSTVDLVALNVPASTLYQYGVYDTSLSELGLTAGRSYLFELSRYTGGDDTLSGDLYVRAIRIQVKYDNVKWIPADAMMSVLSADWATSLNAPIATDSNNDALKVRRHDDTDEEGCGIEWYIPLGTAKMGVHLRSRAETAPGVESYVDVTLWYRELADDGSVGAWQAYDLPISVTLPTNEYWQYDFWEIDMANVGLTPGVSYQFEVTRNTAGSSDNLSGDWDTWMYGFEWY